MLEYWNAGKRKQVTHHSIFPLYELVFQCIVAPFLRASNYYILATTGGGSKLRGSPSGEFDHVSLITVTDEGPVMANLRLDGILPHDVTTRADYEIIQTLANAARMPYTSSFNG